MEYPLTKQCFVHGLEEGLSCYVGGIIPSVFATNISVDKSLSLKLKNKKRLLAEYTSKALCSDDGTVTRTAPKSLTGACMIIDLSGFTRLSAELCKDGNTGLDDLRNKINQYFGRFADTVRDHGGDVLHFAGDALISVFPSAASRIELFGFTEGSEASVLDDDLTESSCCLVALLCALRMNEYCIGGDLKTHAAITYGELFLSALGGHENVWKYVVTGKCLAGMDSCLGDAQAEEVVLSADALAQVKTEVEVSAQKLASGNYRISARTKTVNKSLSLLVDSPLSRIFESRRGKAHWAHDSAACLVQFIPRPVLEAISAGLLSGLSELRSVTSVFVKLDDYCHCAADDISTLQTYFFAMQECLAECGGFLRQFLVDDKGCVLIGLWGVPTATYPNNCTRALKCAVMMLRRAGEMKRSVSVGVATGRVYCGLIGSARAQDYVAMGRSVNLSARLMSTSNGMVYLDQQTFERLPLEVSKHLSALPPMKFKGFSEPLVCFQYDGQTIPPDFGRDAHTDSSIIIERYLMKALEEMLVMLKAVAGNPSSRGQSAVPGEDITGGDQQHSKLEVATTSQRVCLDPRLSSGRPYFFVIKGAPGTGKTAVATYLSRRCKRSGFGVHYVKATASDDSSSFSIIRRLIIEVIGGTGAFSDEQSQRTVVESLLRDSFGDTESPEEWPQTRFPVLRRVLGVRWDLTTKCDNSCRRHVPVPTDTVPRILAKLLSARPMLVVIDNAHFMCRESWVILTQLSALQCAGVVVLTVRVDDNKIVFDSSAIDSPTDVSRGHTTSSYDTLSENTDTLGHIRHTAGEYLHKTLLSGDDSKYGQQSARAGGESGYWEEAAHNHLGLYRHQLEYDDLYFKCFPILLSELHLRPLNVNSVRTLLLKSFDNNSIACERMIRTIYRISKGNPFWCWKIINFVQNSGKQLLKFDHQVLMGCVLDKFTDAEKSVIKSAAVIGEEFSERLLKCLLPPFLLKELDDLLLSLVDGGIIFRMSSGVYSFQSSLIRDFTYSLIPPTDASSMHLTVAECMEHLYQTQLYVYTFSLSYHYSCCPRKERAKALHYSSQAALICFNSHRFGDGNSFVRNCLRLVLRKKELLGLLLVVESGLSNIDEFVKLTVEVSPAEIWSPAAKSVCGSERSPALTRTTSSFTFSLGTTRTAGRPPLQPAHSARLYRDELTDIRRRLTEAYVSLGCMGVPSVLLWLWEKLHRAPRVHP